MSMATITQHLRQPVSEREQDVINQLLAAALTKDTETVERMLAKSRTVSMLIQRGAITVQR